LFGAGESVEQGLQAEAAAVGGVAEQVGEPVG
jgi:hypothetical protein